MDFLTLLRILARRWYVVVPMIVLSVVVSMRTVSSVKPDYEAQGTMLLLGPRESAPPASAPPEAAPTVVNPYTSFTSSLSTMAVALQVVVTDGTHRRELADKGLSDDYDAVVGEDGPTIEVTATAPSERVAVETLQTIFSMLSEELQQRQAAVGAPPQLQITAQPLVVPDDAAEVSVARDRAMAALAVLGLLATISAGLITDSLATNRQRRTTRGRHEWLDASGAAPSDAIDTEWADRVDEESLDAPEAWLREPVRARGGRSPRGSA